MRTAQIGPDLRLPLGKSKTLIDEYVRENILPKLMGVKGLGGEFQETASHVLS